MATEHSQNSVCFTISLSLSPNTLDGIFCLQSTNENQEIKWKVLDIPSKLVCNMHYANKEKVNSDNMHI